jgi:hypothetical protein
MVLRQVQPMLNGGRGGEGGRKQPAHWIFFVVFYAVLANIPFWYAKQEFKFFHDGWFCLEYAIVGLLALYIPRILAALLLFAVICTDVLCAICETYFLSPAECITNLRSMHEISGSRPVPLITVWVITLIVVAIAAFFPITAIRRNARGRAALCLVGFIAICAGVDGINVIRLHGGIPNPLKPARPPDAVKLSTFGQLRLVRRTTVRLVYLVVNDAGMAKMEKSYQAAEVFPVESATGQAIKDTGLFAMKDPATEPNVVVVLLESWGLSTDATVRETLTKPYTQPALLARYQVQQGTAPFFGPTVEGEGRELCGSKIGFHLLTAAAKELQDCKPERFAAMGYEDISVHGLDGNMFSRLGWYKHLGFKESLFRDQFRALGLPDCVGAFTGTCDASIAAWIGQRLATTSAMPRFIYWVTLNSHLPVPVPAPLANAAPCSVAASLQTQPPLCSWYQLIENVHESVAQLAMMDESRPTIFVVVGDHAPPFGEAAIRMSFSSSEVPYVLLIPKQLGVPAQTR